MCCYDKGVNILIYPDDYVIKFFFKNNFDSDKYFRKKVLELGCGDGNNLQLFAKFGWACTGIDKSESDLLIASRRLIEYKTKFGTDIEFLNLDLDLELPDKLCNDSFDVIIVPSVLYYLSDNARENLLVQSKKWLRSSMSPHFFIRERIHSDFRNNISQQFTNGRLKIISNKTGELNSTINSKSIEEINDEMSRHFGDLTSRFIGMRVYYENLQSDEIVDNRDYIVWF